MALWRSGAGGALSTGPLVLGLAGEQGSAASREIEWLFFPGSPPRKAQAGGALGAVPHDSATTKFQWARQGAVFVSTRPASVRWPKATSTSCSFLVGYCSSSGQLRGGGSGTLVVQSRRRRQQCASFSRGLDWYGRHKIRKSTQVMPSRIVSVPGSPNCSVGRSVLGGVCWRPGAGGGKGGRYEPVDRLIDVDKLLDGDGEVQSVDRMHAKWRVSNSADEKKRFVLCPSPQTHSEPKSIGNVHRSVRGQPRLHSVGLE